MGLLTIVRYMRRGATAPTELNRWSHHRRWDLTMMAEAGSVRPHVDADSGVFALETTPDIALSVRGVSKIYPGTRALDDVSLEIYKGEIHGLCGGNGSGKSTLIKILCGVVDADSGVVQIGDREIDAVHLTAKLGHELGIHVVHQDLAMFPDLSVAENMVLGTEFPTTGGRVRWREVNRRAQALIKRFEISVTPRTRLRELPVAVRTQVAIARALQDVQAGDGLVILDEPTASLPKREIEILHGAIRRLAADGHSILFVSHRLGEVLELTNRVTILRDGRVMATHETRELTEEELVSGILGNRAQEVRLRRDHAETGDTLLRVTDLCAGPVSNVTLEVRAGEVVGVAGLLGSGRSELLRAIYGDLSKQSGTITVNGKPANFTRSEQAVKNGVIMVPEDRVSAATFLDLTVNQNLDVSVLNRYWRGRFHRGRMRLDANQIRRSFSVKTSDGSASMSSLSGGNQQKVVLARWLRRDPLLLLLDEPTQGVDVGARADIYAAVRRLTDRGAAALVVVSDIDEMAQVVDRAVILQDGAVAAHLSHDELTAQRLNELLIKRREASE
jgi:ribose transport system ATP-binding protein